MEIADAGRVVLRRVLAERGSPRRTGQVPGLRPAQPLRYDSQVQSAADRARELPDQSGGGLLQASQSLPQQPPRG